MTGQVSIFSRTMGTSLMNDRGAMPREEPGVTGLEGFDPKPKF
jgi:hypothetical protein